MSERRSIRRLLEGGFGGRFGRWVRRFNVATLLLSLATACFATVSFIHVQELSTPWGGVATFAGWVFYQPSPTDDDVDWSAQVPMVQEAGKPLPVTWRANLADHIEWPVYYIKAGARSWWQFSLLQAAFHLWWLPVICIVRAATRTRAPESLADSSAREIPDRPQSATRE